MVFDRENEVGDSKRDKQDDGKDCTSLLKSSTASSKSSPISRRESKTNSCPECHRGFSRKYTLARHLKTHSGEKPFRCEVCEKAFSQKHSLTNHNRIHTGEKPFTCDICKKKFRLKAHIRRHMNVHIPKSERIKVQGVQVSVHQRNILCEHRNDHEEDN